MQATDIRSERARALATVKDIIAPHLKPSGLRATQAGAFLDVWVARDKRGYPTGRTFRLDGYTVDAFEGVCASGVLVAIGYETTAVREFRAMPLEDLLKLETWAARQFSGQPAS